MIYQAELRNGKFSSGIESLEVSLFDWEHIPWQDLAFPSVHWALKHDHKSRGRKLGQPWNNPEKELGDFEAC